MSRKGKKQIPFDEWPADAQLAFEKYYALDGAHRTHSAAAALSGATLNNVQRWSSRYGWGHEIERRDRALAEEERRRTLERRRGVLQAAEMGVGALITRYAAAAQNKCPICMGKGRVRRLATGVKNGRLEEKEDDCPQCEGTGFYSAMDVNVLAFDRAIARYGVMAGDLSDPTDTPRGPISHDEWAEYQRDMLERAGAKVAKRLSTLKAEEQ